MKKTYIPKYERKGTFLVADNSETVSLKSIDDLFKKNKSGIKIVKHSFKEAKNEKTRYTLKLPIPKDPLESIWCPDPSQYGLPAVSVYFRGKRLSIYRTGQDGENGFYEHQEKITKDLTEKIRDGELI